jgi:hypothetical protein
LPDEVACFFFWFGLTIADTGLDEAKQKIDATSDYVYRQQTRTAVNTVRVRFEGLETRRCDDLILDSEIKSESRIHPVVIQR